MNGSIERSGNTAEGIVSGSVGAVEADRNAADAGIDDHARNIFGHERTVGGQGDAQPFVGRVASELENIGTVERFSAAQYENRVRGCGDLVDDAECGAGGKIGGRTQLRGGCAALNATQVASLGDFPENQTCLVFAVVTVAFRRFHRPLPCSVRRWPESEQTVSLARPSHRTNTPRAGCPSRNNTVFRGQAILDFT